MLGLKDVSTYQSWTTVFNPTSTVEGKWEEGSKIYFVGTDEHGNKGGMVSQIEALQPSRFVSIKHIGFLQNGKEITTGEQVECWSGGYESYTFEEQDGITTITVDLDTVEEYMDFFNEKYPQALSLLKEGLEK